MRMRGNITPWHRWQSPHFQANDIPERDHNPNQVRSTQQIGSARPNSRGSERIGVLGQRIAVVVGNQIEVLYTGRISDIQDYSLKPKMDTTPITRALLVLDLLLEVPQGIELPELLERVEISRSALYVLLNTLKTAGYVEQAERRGRYRAGPRLLAWRGSASLTPNLQTAFLQEAATAGLRETVALALPLAGGVLLAAQTEGTAQVRCVFAPGWRFSHSHVTTQVLDPAPRLKLRRAGHALTRSAESVELALPICPDGQIPGAALLLCAPTQSWKGPRLSEVLAVLRPMAARLSYRLGALRYAPWQTGPDEPMVDGRRRALTRPAIATFLAEPWIARLACLRPDGAPHVVPVWQEWDGTHFFVAAWQGSLWADYVHANPRVSLTVDEPWQPLRRVLARGSAAPLRLKDVPGGLSGLIERLRRRYLGPSGALPAAEWQAFRITPDSLVGWQGLA